MNNRHWNRVGRSVLVVMLMASFGIASAQERRRRPQERNRRPDPNQRERGQNSSKSRDLEAKLQEALKKYPPEKRAEMEKKLRAKYGIPARERVREAREERQDRRTEEDTEPTTTSTNPVASTDGSEPYEGFGVNSGGGKGKVVDASNASALKSALGQSGVVVKMKAGKFDGSFRISKGNLTLDGGGSTIFGAREGLQVHAHNVIVKNLRVRNATDNIDTGTNSNRDSAKKVLFSHVTVSGASDDGMSIAYGGQEITVQYSAFLGNSRNCFIKYGADKVTLHHNWFRGQWIRGPLVNDAMVDMRNNLVEEWTLWGSRFEGGSSGNAINNVFIQNWAAGNGTNALYSRGADSLCFKGNIGIGKAKPNNTGGNEISAPKVTTHEANQVEKLVRDKAGCLPRDEIDKKLISMKQAAGNGRGLQP